jgi:hypothetical protein
MTRSNVLKSLTSMATVLALAVGPMTVATFTLSPDIAFAKNDKGNGGGKGGGGKDRSDRGKGKDKSASNKGKSNGSKSKGNTSRTANANGKNDLGKAFKDIKRGFQKAANGKGKPKQNKASNGSRDPKSLADAGRIFTRDVKAIFGVTDDRKPTKASRSAALRKPTSVSVSPRPARRDEVKTAFRPDDAKRPVRGARDPLVRAITAPDGSDKLRNLSASTAAAAAFANASPNSNVGKIATYQQTSEDYYDLRSELIEGRRDLRALDDAYEGRTRMEVSRDIDALDPNDPAYEEALGALEGELKAALGYETERKELANGLRDLRGETADALTAAEAAFFAASKGRTVTRDTLAELHDNLDLPQPGTGPGYRAGADVKSYLVDAEARTLDAYDANRRDWSRKGGRDPLVRAITDADGSDKLRNLNASKAASAALANASPNSNVGRIAAYQAAAEDYYGLRDNLSEARQYLRGYDESYDGRSSEDVLDAISALDAAEPAYDARLAELEQELAEAERFEEGRDPLADAVRELRRDSLIAGKKAESAFYAASRGTILSLSALAELNANLGLPSPGK